MRLMVLFAFAVFAHVAMALVVVAQDTPRIGIFGSVERISPLVIAGVEIVVPQDVPVLSPLGPEQGVLLGDTLAVVVTLEAEQVVAARILAVYPLIGPVADTPEQARRVMGTAFHLPPGTVLSSGEWVAFSGFWSGGTLITTNLRKVEPGGFGQLAGVVDRDSGRIGESEIRADAPPPDGFGADIWMLSGAPDPAGLRVQLMAKGMFGGAVDLVLWQGHATAPVASQTYMVYGTGITGTARDAQMPDAGDFITRCVRERQIVHAPPQGAEAAFAAFGCARHIPVD